MSTALFPASPPHGMVFELSNGLFFKYDITTRSWIKLSSAGVVIPLATPVANGTMSSIDLKKLNRLVLPPPQSSIIGTDCVSPFQSGTIGLYSGDKFVGVDGTVKLQNIGPTGASLSRDTPFRIHQHTYGFDFTIDLPELVEELKSRRQFNVAGRRGVQGDDGAVGGAGPDSILTGPPGDEGQAGAAPACGLTVETDNLQVEPIEGMTKALVSGNVVFDKQDPLKYKIVFDRQSIGPTGYAAEALRVGDGDSSWVLAVTGDQTDADITDPRSQLTCGAALNAGKPQQIYYIDIDSIVASIHNKFLAEANVMKAGYQNVVRFWVHTMSDLFDEQKSALCCALEHCLSIKKNQDTRDSIDSLAASAAGSANILLHGRNSNESVDISSTRILRQLGYPDTCKNDKQTQQFPQYPNIAGGGVGGFGPTKSAVVADKQAASEEKTEPQTVAVDEAIISIDPLSNSTLATAVIVPLMAGHYSATLTNTDAQIDGKYYGNIKIQHTRSGLTRFVQFLDKGEFENVHDAKSAYEGLSLSFNHDGGNIAAWLPSVAPQQGTGTVKILIQRMSMANSVVATPAVVEAIAPSSCQMEASHLAWYERGWLSGNCCGLVINVAGQDWIVVKRSFGTDVACGGGESEIEPCIRDFMKSRGHVAFAWPTFDGETFAPIPIDGSIGFHFDESLNELAARKIVDGEFENAKGNPAGVRHLTYQLSTILFPAS